MKSFIAFAVLLVSYIGLASTIQKRSTVCETDGCESAAQYLLNAIDQSIDPCTDFYEFSCRKFIKNNPLPADEINYGTHEILTDNALELIQVILETPNSSNTKAVQKAQSLYSICLEQEDDIALLKSAVKALGGWTLVTQQTNTISLEVLLANVTLTGVVSIVDIEVDSDLVNSSQNIIQIGYPDLILPANLLGTQDSLNDFNNFIKAIAETLGAPDSQNTTDQINDLVQFGLSIADMVPEEQVIKNFTKFYKKMTIGELQQLTDPTAEILNWLTYLNALFSVELTSSEPVGVWDSEYLVNVIQLIKSTNRDTVVNYIIARFVSDYSVHAGGELLKQYVDLTLELSGITAFPPRNTSCTDFTNEVFGFALAKQFVAETFSPSNMQDVHQIAQSLQSAFKVGVSHTSFYDPNTLKTVQQKIAAIQILIGYPEFVNDDQAVETYYSNFPEMNGAHFTNALESQISLVQQNLNLLHAKVDKSSFDLNPSTVGGEYNPSNNAITVTAGILRQPYYTQGQIKALDYGAAGSLIGELFNAAINNNGEQIDINGNLNPIWPENVADAINKTLQCISNQFESYCPSSSNPADCVPGTAAELDVIFGILGALNAYQAWVSENGEEPQLPGLQNYTSTQLLFMNVAQRFCTATVPDTIVDKIGVNQQLEYKYSLIGALASLKEFSDAFKCPVGPMNLGNNSCVQI